MPYMPYQAAVEFAEVIGGAVVLHSAEASLDVPGTGLAGMMARSRAHDRNQSKSEVAAFRRTGGKIEWIPAEQLDDLVAADFVTQNRSRYGNAEDRDWMEKILAGQRKAGVSHFGVAAVSKRNNEPTGMAVFYGFGAALHLRYFGADYNLDLNDYRYFVLCYYEPVEYAAARGFKTLRLSTSALRAKVNRGAKIEPQAIVVKCVSELHICRSEIKRHNRCMLRQYQDQFPGHLGRDWELVESHQDQTG
ncbi:peptidogalycan biosysnthesis protein [Bradyrhizobium sp. LB11.1]|uniref:peptidogalycan biosysnthesis protein n=1 Tax=Bradyrhizobium sp. LB11.1 TaxID=3156326 RepID=UPI0033925FF4